MTELNCKLDGSQRGDANYADYLALWHLFEIGVVTDLKFNSEGWDLAEARQSKKHRPTRVALIDVSVAYHHPNLVDAIDTDLMIDFFSARLGTFPKPSQTHPFTPGPASRHAAPLGLGPIVNLFTELTAHLPGEYIAARGPWNQRQRVLPATSADFSAHGTAMAGLIGARPKGRGEVEFVIPARIPLSEEDGTGIPLPPAKLTAGPSLPYVGVDPFCEIVPISTSFDPDPEQLILTLLYAWLIGADIIVLARDFPDPLRSAITGRRTSEGKVLPEEEIILREAYPCELSEHELELWSALHELVLEVSRTVPVVCAAGNGYDDSMIYPASLAAAPVSAAHAREGNGNGIIAVGARAATRQRAAYSTTSTQAGQISIYAPSGDGERLDIGMQRLDTLDPDYRPYDQSDSYKSKLNVEYTGAGTAPHLVDASTYSTQPVISTDVPGAAGYNGSPFPYPTDPAGAIYDYRSYYCNFSGTSAACAIVAGMLSLAYSAGKIEKGNGSLAKTLLRGGTEPVDDTAGTPALRWSVL